MYKLDLLIGEIGCGLRDLHAQKSATKGTIFDFINSSGRIGNLGKLNDVPKFVL